MGAFKALTLASAMVLANAGATFAADLLPPPPPEPVLIADPDFSGWYIRGDVGVGINSLKMRASTFTAYNPLDPKNDVKRDQASLGDSTFLRLGVGYQINNWFRADVTGEYRTSSIFHSIESFKNTSNFAATGIQDPLTTGPNFGSCGQVVNLDHPVGVQNALDGLTAQDRCYDKYTSSVRSAVLMANGYVDLGTWYNLTPYVGAGIGAVNHRWSGLTDQGGNNTGFGFAKSSSQTNLAWALMTGVAYSVTPNLKLELGYRYLNMGGINSKAIICSVAPTPPACHLEVQHAKLSSSDIHIGMRWLISANSYGNGQALYWGQNGAASGSLTGGGGYAAGGGGYAAAGGYGGGAGLAPPPGALVKRY